MNPRNHPGVYVPPPLLYAAFFLLSLLLQKWWPLERAALHTPEARVLGALLVAGYVVVFVLALRQFVASRNTLVTIKPATSLQTTGIYAFTRNPMYLSLVLLYAGLAVLVGNWWTLMLLPLLIAVVQLYVIRREEQYLQEAFGQAYDAYRRRVNRWIGRTAKEPVGAGKEVPRGVVQ